MDKLDLKTLTPFTGRLSFGSSSVDIVFSAILTDEGELQLEFPKIPLGKETAFIQEGHNSEGATFSRFSLDGVASDGTKFHSDRVHLKSINWNFFPKKGRQISIAGSCTIASLVRSAPKAPLPRLTMFLKGFFNYGSLHADCPLGKVVMNGKTRDANSSSNLISGWILIEAVTLPADVAKWRHEAELLLEHIRVVMSLAAATLLRAPVRHFQFEDELAMSVWSQSEQRRDSLRIIHEANQEGVFAAAVSSFFLPPIKAKSFRFAVEWFAMDASYNEVRLANAMTALENLVNSNLDDSEIFIQEPKAFDKLTRRALRNLIKACVEREQLADSDELIAELNEKLPDLNRRSLYRKLHILAERWSISFNKIDQNQIRGALKARNSVVHRGQYYDNGQQENSELIELWDHAMVVREIVARFLLTIVGYRGPYTSYIGGFHTEQLDAAAGSTHV